MFEPVPSPIIETKKLTRDFKQTRAVSSLDLTIYGGELFGLVGPDGAGKTTTIRILAGLLDISSGEASVAGFDLSTQAEEIKPEIGYMAQQFSLYGELSVFENLSFFAEIYDVPKEERAERMSRLLEFSGLTKFKDRRGAHLSGGMQKKLALASTLIHTPEILLLDEPTTGVDPISRREFWDILYNLHLDGTTIVVSTPYMDEADRCSRVGLMYQGRLVICDTPKKIRKQINAEMIQFIPENWQSDLTIFRNKQGVIEVQTYGESLHILVDSADKRLPEIRHMLDEEGIVYRKLRKAPIRMEEAFISLVQKFEL